MVQLGDAVGLLCVRGGLGEQQEDDEEQPDLQQDRLASRQLRAVAGGSAHFVRAEKTTASRTHGDRGYEEHTTIPAREPIGQCFSRSRSEGSTFTSRTFWTCSLTAKASRVSTRVAASAELQALRSNEFGLGHHQATLL